MSYRRSQRRYRPPRQKRRGHSTPPEDPTIRAKYTSLRRHALQSPYIPSYALRDLIRDLEVAPSFSFPFPTTKIDRNARDTTGLSRRFTGFQRRIMTEYSRGRCEVPSCRATAEDAPLTVHHIRFRRYGGKNALGNAEVVCADCHQGAHGGVDHSSATIKGDAVAVSGIPIRTMFQVLDLFTRARIVTATPVYGQSDGPSPLSFRNAQWNHRRAVVSIRLRGPGVEAFRDCQRVLAAAVHEAHLDGRLSASAERILLRFVAARYVRAEAA